VYEPAAKNTAPAIALLCKALALRGALDEVVGVFPADQLVDDEGAFHRAVARGVGFARQGEVVTLGVIPTFPATGYGYIETDGKLADGAFKASGFREKPNEETARDFIARGGFFWNAGMFIFKVSKMIEHLKHFAPDIWTAIDAVKPDFSNLDAIYKSVRSVSIDYAVMEKLSSHVCIPCDFGWSDLGTWDAIANVMSQSAKRDKNFVGAGFESSNFVFPIENKTYGFVGVEDLIVVDTADALLITRKGSSERVKEIVDQLKKQSVQSATQHSFEVRPWGQFEVLRDNADFKSKTIVVDSGAQLSYQSHAKRAEHWIIVKGSGEVVLNDEIIPVTAGTHVHIPLGAKHRMRNTGAVPLHFVEVQLGAYFGEDDIVRYQDDYARTVQK